jgi:hypothetical protein
MLNTEVGLLEIPSQVTHLTYMFPKADSAVPLPTLLPSISKLELGGYIPKEIDSLLPFLIHLTFGDSFNQNISHILPSPITHLTFGNNFNHPLPYLPALTFLSLGYEFNHPLDKELFPSLLDLKIRNGSSFAGGVSKLRLEIAKFTHPLSNLPASLSRLVLCSSFAHELDSLPLFSSI